MKFLLPALLWSAPAFAQICIYDVSPPSLNLPSSASTGTISVTADSGCVWTVSNTTLAWLKFDPAGGAGKGTITYTALANPTGADRSGTVTIAGKAVTVKQAAAQCSYVLTPPSQSYTAAGGSGSFQVSTACIWQPVSNNGNVVTVTDTSVRAGDGTVNYKLGVNGCVYGRNTGITVNTTSTLPAQPVFTISQDGSPANMTLSATSANAGPEEADGRITVTTGTGCSWSASSDVSWMRITSGAQGSGNGGIAYHLLANNTAPRTGSIHVGNLTYTVTQAASGPPLPVVNAVTSAANYASDAVSPGEIVVLFGSNMGPAALATLQLVDGSVSSVLAGTQVLFDGVPGPLIYTRADQVSAVVPYGVAEKTSMKVQAVYNGLKSAEFTVPVQAAHPAIFSLDKTGTGPGAILNQDGTTNSFANTALRGSVVQIFATGGGVTNPALSDGAVTGAEQPLLTGKVSVTIGGFDARVEYAGGAPGAVAGLTQINAVVPLGVVTGRPAEVVVRVGGYPSSSGITITVR